MSKMQGKLKQKMRVNMEKHLGKMVKGLGKSLSLGMSVKIMRVMMARFLRVKLMIMLLRMGMGSLVMASWVKLPLPLMNAMMPLMMDMRMRTLGMDLALPLAPALMSATMNLRAWELWVCSHSGAERLEGGTFYNASVWQFGAKKEWDCGNGPSPHGVLWTPLPRHLSELQLVLIIIFLNLLTLYYPIVHRFVTCCFTPFIST